MHVQNCSCCSEKAPQLFLKVNLSLFRDTSRWGTPGGVRNSLIVLAYPYSAYSAKGGLDRAQAVPHGRVFFLGFHALSQARHTCSFSPGRDNYLFGPCDPQLYLSHGSLRSVSGLFLAKRSTFSVDSSAIVPAGLVGTGPGRVP